MQGGEAMLLGEFKQELMRLNNRINMEIFGQGLIWQRMEIFGDKVLIIAHNKRVKALSSIDRQDSLHSKLTDIALIMDFKERFIKLVEDTMGVKVLAHLKDYDPRTELSFSVTIFEKNIDELIKGIQLKK